MDAHLDLGKFFSVFPILYVGDYILREIVQSDDNSYYALLSDVNVGQYLSDEDVPNSVYQAREEIKFWGGLFHKRQSIFWAVAKKSDDELIGTIGFNYWNFNNSRAEVSYELNSAYWRRGIMSQVLNEILRFASDKMHIHRMEAKTMTHNAASSGLLLKAGFKKDGLLRDYRKVRGKFIDVDLYSCILS